MRHLAENFHPSEFIEEEMAERGWSSRDLAAKMRGDDGPIKDLFMVDMYLAVRDPNLRMGGYFADGLSRAFGTSKEFWLNLEAAWLVGTVK